MSSFPAADITAWKSTPSAASDPYTGLVELALPIPEDAQFRFIEEPYAYLTNNVDPRLLVVIDRRQEEAGLFKDGWLTLYKYHGLSLVRREGDRSSLPPVLHDERRLGYLSCCCVPS